MRKTKIKDIGQQRGILTGCILLMVFIAVILYLAELGVITLEKTDAEKKAGHTEWTSKINQEDCIICKELNGPHLGEDNLGIVNLHDGTYHYIRINKNEELENPDGFFQIESSLAEANKIKITVQADADRGYARIDIDLGDEKQIDLEKVSGTCCQKCIDNILDEMQIEGSLFGVAVLNYKNDGVKVLSRNIKAYLEGDFYVDCEFRTEKEDDEIAKIELLVFYCPVRV